MKDHDNEIISLFVSRSEEAIVKLTERYGRLGLGIAENILSNHEDAEECISDALRVLWEKIPPEKPDPLLPYFLRVVRNIALNKRRAAGAKIRSDGENLPIDDFAELIAFDDREEEMEEIRAVIDSFLTSLPKKDRSLFIRRYWFEDEITDIAIRFGITENHVRVKLTRLKAKLKKHLEKEGIDV